MCHVSLALRNFFLNFMCHVTGGCDDTLKLHAENRLLSLFRGDSVEYDYDLIVVGGGSGGLAAAKARPVILFFIYYFLFWGLCISSC
jgi:hypothetical protein